MTKIEQFNIDIARLSNFGGRLVLSMYKEFDPNNIPNNNFSEEDLSNLPNFNLDYEPWYSECIALVKQLLPGRESNFRAYYEQKSTRREIDYSNYVIKDALRVLNRYTGGREDFIFPKKRDIAGLSTA